MDKTYLVTFYGYDNKPVVMKLTLSREIAKLSNHPKKEVKEKKGKS